jgi:hypothetical protein
MVTAIFVNLSRRGFRQTSATAGEGLILCFCFPLADPPPAVANAVLAATSARLRSIPMTPDAVFKAMKG